MRATDTTERVLKCIEKQIAEIRATKDTSGVIIGINNHRAAIRKAIKIKNLSDELIKHNTITY